LNGSTTRITGLALPVSNASIVLHISHKAGSAIFGYTYIMSNECHQEDAITAYFDSAGHEVMVLQCPDFDLFMFKHSLTDCNISFIGDILRYIIPARNRILQVAQYDESLN
jgi:hypothetical protein